MIFYKSRQPLQQSAMRCTVYFRHRTYVVCVEIKLTLFRPEATECNHTFYCIQSSLLISGNTSKMTSTQP